MVRISVDITPNIRKDSMSSVADAKSKRHESKEDMWYAILQ